MQAIGVDDTLTKSLGMPKCKIATLKAAFGLGAAPGASGQLPSEPARTPEATELNARMI
jgi:hypothetical protein